MTHTPTDCHAVAMFSARHRSPAPQNWSEDDGLAGERPLFARSTGSNGSRTDKCSAASNGGMRPRPFEHR